MSRECPKAKVPCPYDCDNEDIVREDVRYHNTITHTSSIISL